MPRGDKRAEVNGYIMIWVPLTHRFASMIKKRTANGGYILEHRLTMATHLGRPLDSQEVVHHKDHCKDNNELSNLELYTSHADHMRLHPPKPGLTPPRCPYPRAHSTWGYRMHGCRCDICVTAMQAKRKKDGDRRRKQAHA